MSKKKIIRNVILVLAILILLLVLMFSIGDIKKIWNVLINTNGWFILLAFAFVILYAISYQASLMILTKYRFKNIAFKDLYYISGTEFFFNAITPFSSGGQPFQAYALKRKGMNLSDSTSVLLINFIAYQICLNVIAVVFMIMYYNRVHNQIDSFITFLIVGFAINTVIMVGLLLIGIVKPVGRIFLKLFDLICKIKFLRKFQHKHDEFELYISNMQTAFRDISKSLSTWCLVILTKVLSFIFYYSIPLIALYAIGINVMSNDYIYILALTAFTLTIAIWVPTPGGSGGVEYAFKELFSPYIEGYGFSQNEAFQMSLALMLIWRLLTYYFLLIYGFVLYLLLERRTSKFEKMSINELAE